MNVTIELYVPNGLQNMRHMTIKCPLFICSSYLTWIWPWFLPHRHSSRDSVPECRLRSCHQPSSTHVLLQHCPEMLFFARMNTLQAYSSSSITENDQKTKDPKRCAGIETPTVLGCASSLARHPQGNGCAESLFTFVFWAVRWFFFTVDCP